MWSKTCALALALWCGGTLAAMAAEPKLKTEKAEFNFGEVFQGEKIEQVFRFRNEGDAPLIIDRVKTSCGCTAALLSASQVAPGKDGEVRTVFDSTRFTGPVAKTIYLYSNDPLQPVVQFALKGTIRQELVVSPPLVDLGVMTAKSTKKAQLELSNLGNEVIELKGVEALAPDLSAELSSLRLGPGESVMVQLRAQPQEGRTRLNGYVIIKTGHSRTPELRVPVYGSVVEAPTH